MTKYTKSELIELINSGDPYQALIKDKEGKSLGENYSTCEELDPKNKLNLATKIIFSCPNDELKKLIKIKEILRHPGASDGSFYNVLTRGLEVRQRIQDLINPDVDQPEKLLLGKEFNGDLFNEFYKLRMKLTIDLTEEALSNLTTKLVTRSQHYPKNELIRNIQIISNKMATNLQKGFILKDLLETLTGDNPWLVFQNGEFNPDLFHNYPDLTIGYLNGNEEKIAQKLASNKAVSFDTINKGLEKLRPSAVDEQHPLNKLYRSFQTALANQPPPKDNQKEKKSCFFFKHKHHHKKEDDEHHAKKGFCCLI